MKHLDIKFILASFYNLNEFYFRIFQQTNVLPHYYFNQYIHFSKIIISISPNLDVPLSLPPSGQHVCVCDKLGDLPICLTCPYFPLLYSILPRFSIFTHLYVILFSLNVPSLPRTRLHASMHWLVSQPYTPAVSLSLSSLSSSLHSPLPFHLPQAFSLSPLSFPPLLFPSSRSLPLLAPFPLLSIPLSFPSPMSISFSFVVSAKSLLLVLFLHFYRSSFNSATFALHSIIRCTFSMFLSNC